MKHVVRFDSCIVEARLGDTVVFRSIRMDEPVMIGVHVLPAIFKYGKGVDLGHTYRHEVEITYASEVVLE